LGKGNRSCGEVAAEADGSAVFLFRAYVMRHLESMFGISAEECQLLLRLAARLKMPEHRSAAARLAEGRLLTLLFEKPSLRTRVSFEAAAGHLGGTSLFLTSAEAGLGGRESRGDVARVLGSYSDWIVLRTFAHSLVDEFVRHAGCPIINGLSDQAHPCQALSDLLTIEETLGSLQGKRLAYVGDGNNVARSLAVGSALCGMEFTIASPPGYSLSDEFTRKLAERLPQARVIQCTDPREAVKSAQIVYTDVWASMGQEAELEKRKAAFAPYQVNARLMAAAPREARFMHCMPAKRNQEVTDDVLDGPQSIVLAQATNRLHMAKAILVWLLGVETL
jgi:ornithine carbamoyltransferase